MPRFPTKSEAGQRNEAPQPASEETTRPVLHVNGEPVPEHMAHAIPYANTDEGIAERAAKGAAWAARVNTGRDQLGNIMAQRADSMEPWESHDPMQELVANNVEPGQRARFISDGVVRVRGYRGWQPVIDPKGNPVKLGEMTLATMPEEKARKRERHFAALTAERTQEAQDNVQEQQERLIGEARGAGISALSSGELVRDYQSGEVVTAGLQSTRGNSTELLR